MPEHVDKMSIFARIELQQPSLTAINYASCVFHPVFPRSSNLQAFSSSLTTISESGVSMVLLTLLIAMSEFSWNLQDEHILFKSSP